MAPLLWLDNVNFTLEIANNSSFIFSLPRTVNNSD